MVALLDPQHSICFSGPRPFKLPDAGDENAASTKELTRRLEHALVTAIHSGSRFFLNGCMAGFDIMAGEAVLRVKNEYPHIRCISVAPFRRGYFLGSCWNGQWKQRALSLYQSSDAAFTLSETYHQRVYYERDEYLVNHSVGLICYYNGTNGGTKYTMELAARKQLSIWNLTLPLTY